MLDLQNRLTLSESDVKHLKEQLALSEAKVRALEAFSSDVQQKYDKLVEKQRKYFQLVKDYQNECQRNEQLSAGAAPA